MGTETRKLEDGKKSDCWHVRNEQGETFGPVGLETLKAWACDGRLGPTNEVSETGAAWQLATSLRALEMDWVAEVTSGTFYGPIHRRALEELVKDNSISSQSSFFSRRGLAERAEPLADGGQTEAVRRLSDQVAQALQRAAAGDAQMQQMREQLAAQVEQAQRQAAHEQQLRQQSVLQAEEAQRKIAAHEQRTCAAQQQMDALMARVEQAQRQVAAYEEQVRAAQQQVTASAAQVEQAQQQAALEQQKRLQAVSQAEDARRLVASHEERVRVAQQQQAANAAQAEQARQLASAAEARLCELAQQISEQAEQARVLQLQWNAKSDTFAHELQVLRTEQSEALAAVAKVRSERDAQAVALEAQVRAFDAERQELQAALGHAKARCTTVEAALEEARARYGRETSLADVSDELKQVRRQVEALCVQCRQANEARDVSQERRAEERVAVEPVEVEVLPPEDRPKAAPKAREAERVAPEWRRGQAEAPSGANAGRAASGLSMADLEQQARRELERLGAQGVNLFKKKR